MSSTKELIKQLREGWYSFALQLKAADALEAKDKQIEKLLAENKRLRLYECGFTNCGEKVKNRELKANIKELEAIIVRAVDMLPVLSAKACELQHDMIKALKENGNE